MTESTDIHKAIEALKEATAAASNVLKDWAKWDAEREGSGRPTGKNADASDKAAYHDSRADYHASVARDLQSKIDNEYKTQGMASARWDPKVGDLVQARDANQLASSTNRDVAFDYKSNNADDRADAENNANKYANKYSAAADKVNASMGIGR